MLHFYLLFKFPNKIKSKYLEESRVGSGKGRGRGETPHVASLGSHRGPDYPGSRTWSA